jgi:alpha-L-rhamnosidase
VCWDYQYLAGIRLKDGATAFSEVVVEPRFIGDLEWVRASVKLPKGELSSAWSRKNGKTELIVRVPEGTRAFVRLPGGRESIVGPGIQTFAVE